MGTYKDKPLWRRSLLWLRYKPVAYVRGVLWGLIAAIREPGFLPGFVIWSRRKRFWHGWTLALALADIKMGNTITTEEWLRELRKFAKC